MKRTKRIAASVLTGVLMFTSVFMPSSVDAQVKYDPAAEGNNGFYIDTVAVPKDDNIKVEGTGGDQEITAVKNVKFKLYSSVDASWSIKAADAAAGDGKVTIGEKSGVVKIQPDAKDGNYTITAKSENVTATDEETIKLKVDGSKAAKATGILWDQEAMDSDQMIVSEDGKTLTIDGTVKNEDLAVKYEPDYLVDNAVSFKKDTDDQIYTLSEDTTKITTLKKLDDGEIECTVGDSAATSHENLKLSIKEKAFTSEIVCREMTAKDGEYNLSKDQEIHLACLSNEAVTLPKTGVTDVVWTLRQGSAELQQANETTKINNTDYWNYTVMDEDGTAEFAHIYVPAEGDTNEIIVRTVSDTKAKTVPAVKLDAEVTTDADNAGNEYHKTVTLKFNPAQTAEPSKVSLDFAAAGLREDIDYSVRHDLDINKDGEITEEDPEVYYFEADGDNLNLVAATVSNVPGVRSFEDAKAKNFTGDGAAYKMTYELQDAELFGSASANESYNNSDLKAEELGADNTLKNNNKFTKQGIGYKKLTIECKKGTTQVDKKTYYIRFVSPSGKLANEQREYKISKNSTTWYAYEAGEPVHVRMGEATVPGFYRYDADQSKYIDLDKVTLFNPFIEYSVEDESIATAVLSNESYRVSGVNSGIVRVTAYGAVNKGNIRTFELYVNKDTYPVKDGDFEIDFSAAQKSGVMSTANVVDGKQKKVPVSVSVTTPNLGIPKLTWSLAWADSEETEDLSEFATIDEKTGEITTKKSTNSEIKIVATAANGISESARFTIGEVEGTSIKTIAEKVDGKAVVEALGENSGKCKVGNVFTLYPEDYLPENATKLSGTIRWSSSNASVASVEKDTGKVTALAETTGQPVVITATYTAGGNQVATEYKLTIEGSANPVTAIQAADQVLNFKGAVVELKDKITVLPADATNKAVTYKSSNDAIATVNQSGTVTAVGVGECTITITSVDNPDVTKTIKITVKGDSNSATGGNTTPSGQNPGAQTSANTGTSSTASQNENGVSAVKKPIIKLAKKKIKRKKKTKITIKNKAKGAKVTYKLNKKSKKIVSVSKKGVVKGKKKGTAKIVVTVKQNGKTYKKTLKIKVTK